jgi:hypothetical protein
MRGVTKSVVVHEHAAGKREMRNLELKVPDINIMARGWLIRQESSSFQQALAGR